MKGPGLELEAHPLFLVPPFNTTPGKAASLVEWKGAKTPSGIQRSWMLTDGTQVSFAFLADVSERCRSLMKVRLFMAERKYNVRNIDFLSFIRVSTLFQKSCSIFLAQIHSTAVRYLRHLVETYSPHFVVSYGIQNGISLR